MGISVQWLWTTVEGFARFEVQQRTNGLQLGELQWLMVASITDPAQRQWAGGPVPFVDASHPVRVVVFNNAGQSAASNEMAITLTGGTPVPPPSLNVVRTASGTTVYVEWGWSGAPSFSHYVVQQRDMGGTWHDLATISQFATQSWTGAPYAMDDPDTSGPFRVVVFNMLSQSAASDERTIASTALAAPVLGTVTRIGDSGAHVSWTWTGGLNFDRFVVQQKDLTNAWLDLGTLTDPGAVEWPGPFFPGG